MLIRRTLAFLGVAIICASLFGQSAAPEGASAVVPAPMPSARLPPWKVPPGVKPRAGHGERLLVRSATGASVVVRLHCTVGSQAWVMVPTGELKLIELAKTQPTTAPFVAATAEQLQESLKAAGFSKFKFEQGKFYFYVYSCSDAFFMHTRSILESMLPGVVGNLKALGLTVERPAVPLVVVIMPSRAAFDAYQPMPKEAVAYYDLITNRIVMYEDQRLWSAAPEYAAKQGAYTIAHEGVHQLLGNIGIQSRLSNWPQWISEGLAEYYCPLKVSSSIVRKGNAELPERTLAWSRAGMVNDIRMYGLLGMKTGSGGILRKLVEAENIDTDGYALAWGLVHYLASRKAPTFRAYLADLSKYKPLDPETEPSRQKGDPLFVKHFGSDFAGLEREVQAYLTSKKMQDEYLDPFANQTHYIVRAVQKMGRSTAITMMITTSPAAAKKWKEEQEVTNKKANFYTMVCKSRAEAERQVKKLQ